MKTIQIILLAWLLAIIAGPVRALETLRPEQLKPGMKGYGLSVFRGTKPERFDVEIIGVLPNAMPKQDMILIRCSGLNLEKTKTIAGMSGSPIYIEGKLIGALAYGWSFENEPLAGVTPIHNMLAEIDKPSGVSPAAPGPVSAAANAATARPLLTPLALGGFSARTVAAFAGQFEKWGFVPVVAGGSSAPLTAPRRGGPLEPGGSIGVQLIRGDFNATAVGTVTYVHDNKILAFGHPFFSSGQFTAPAVEAEVLTIMSSLERSFKMATGRGEIGALIGDWQSCIVADTKVAARMIPVSVAVANRTTGDHQTYRLEVADNPALSSRLILMALSEVIGAASASSQDTMVHVTTEAEITAAGRDRTLRVSNTFYNPFGGLVDGEAFDPILAMLRTPFGDPRVRRLTMTVDAVQQRQTAEIKRAYFHKSQVERGERAQLSVVLKPYGQPEITQTVELEIPTATETMRQFAVAILAGEKAPADIAPPDNLTDFLDAIEKQHRATDLVILVQTPGQGLQYRGKLLKNLPASALDVLNDNSRRDVTGAADVQQIVIPTDWVLTGQAVARVPIRQESAQ